MNVDEERLKKGLYWQRAWKLVEGCTKVSPGCENCWSESETVMRAGHPNVKINTRAGKVLDSLLADQFDGSITMREDNLNLPLTIKKPTVFAIWNDLFHIDVSCDFINEAYDVMVRCPQHTFLVLTKRAAAMMSYTKYAITEDSKRTPVWTQRCTDEEGDFTFPSNIYHGVTICNQEEADHKIHYLLQVPGKRFLSIEPLLGPIDLTGVLTKPQWGEADERDLQPLEIVGRNDLIHQVLLGGESGKNARPMHPDWIRTIRDQCEASGVSFMFKQWGEWYGGMRKSDHKGPIRICRGGLVEPADYKEQPRAFIAFGCEAMVQRIGKKKAGRTLDGKLHDDLIWKQEAVKS